MFTYPLLQGSAAGALSDPGGIAISRKMAEQFFGGPQQAFVQLLRFDNQEELKVTAVFENVPASSSQQFDFLRNWKSKYGCQYGTHFVPHDARPRRLGMGGKSILQQFNDHNVGRFVITANLDVQEGIQAARATFPHCRFDAVRCADGIEALKQYHRSWDEEKQQFSTVPVHDWSSHAADAFRYLSLSWKHPKTKQELPPRDVMQGSINNISFGELKKQHFKRMQAQREGI